MGTWEQRIDDTKLHNESGDKGKKSKYKNQTYKTINIQGYRENNKSNILHGYMGIENRRYKITQ